MALESLLIWAILAIPVGFLLAGWIADEISGSPWK